MPSSCTIKKCLLTSTSSPVRANAASVFVHVIVVRICFEYFAVQLSLCLGPIELKSSDARWLRTVQEKGTLSDKVAALTLQIQVGKFLAWALTLMLVHIL